MSDLERLYRGPARKYEPDVPPIWSSPRFPAPPPQLAAPDPPPRPKPKPKEISDENRVLLDDAVAALKNGKLSDEAKQILALFVKHPEKRVGLTRISRETQLPDEQVVAALVDLVAGGHLRVAGSVGRTSSPAFGMWR